MSGHHLLTASAESLFLWDLSSRTLLRQFDAPGTSGSTVPPGGSALFVQTFYEQDSEGAYFAHVR